MIVIVVLIGLLYFVASHESKITEESVLLPAGAITATDRINGTATSTVTLLEFSDFQCPACGEYFPVIEDLISEYKGQVALVYKNFPLPQHKNARVAAYAAEAAGRQGKFFEMYRLLFSNQEKWAELASPLPIIEGFAASLGLNMEQFKKDSTSAEVKSKIDADLALGQASQVLGTPTFFLEGVKIASPNSYQDFKNVIDAAIAKKKAAAAAPAPVVSTVPAI